MSPSSTCPSRVLSGMRVSGKLHLGHYHGVLKNWLKLQQQYECFFMVADWHGLTTHYDEPQVIAQYAPNMVIDWLAAGIDPNSAHIFIQSHVPEHAELHLLLSMITPLGWLERIPTYKDQQEKLKAKDLATYGFLGYPLLQSADILIYRASLVPVGEDQLSHIEFTREVARRFNHLYGREPDYLIKAEAAIEKLAKKDSKRYREFLRCYQEQGDEQALMAGNAFLLEQAQLAVNERELLLAYLSGGGKTILPEPQALLTEHAKLPGLDGQKMSKSYHNTIGLRESPEVVEQKIRTMPTDPARVKRTDPGTPEKCPVWDFHQVYSDKPTQEWVQQGCRTAGIGCLDCKRGLLEGLQKELAGFRERAQEFEDNPALVRDILAKGSAAARKAAQDTLVEVRQAMGLTGY